MVNKTTLQVIANDAQRVHGQPTSAFTAAIGFVNGDTAAVVSGVAAVSTTATTVGTYPIMVTQGTLFATNYGFAFGILLVAGCRLDTAGGPVRRRQPCDADRDGADRGHWNCDL